MQRQESVSISARSSPVRCRNVAAGSWWFEPFRKTLFPHLISRTRQPDVSRNSEPQMRSIEPQMTITNSSCCPLSTQTAMAWMWSMAPWNMQPMPWHLGSLDWTGLHNVGDEIHGLSNLPARHRYLSCSRGAGRMAF